MSNGDSIKLKEKVIRMVTVDHEMFVNRLDLIELIKAIRKNAGSLNSQNDLKVLIECLLEGELPEGV